MLLFIGCSKISETKVLPPPSLEDSSAEEIRDQLHQLLSRMHHCIRRLFLLWAKWYAQNCLSFAQTEKIPFYEWNQKLHLKTSVGNECGQNWQRKHRRWWPYFRGACPRAGEQKGFSRHWVCVQAYYSESRTQKSIFCRLLCLSFWDVGT